MERMKGLHIPDAALPDLRRRFKPIADAEALKLQSMTLIGVPLLIMSAIVGILLPLAFPTSFGLPAIVPSLSKWLIHIVGSLLVFALLVLPLIIAILLPMSPDMEPSAGYARHMGYALVLWPALVLSQWLPLPSSLHALKGIQLISLQGCSVGAYPLDAAIEYASVSASLLWCGSCLVIFREILGERLVNRRIKMRYPESFILIKLSEIVFDIVQPHLGTLVVYGKWPAAKLRCHAATCLDDIIDVIEHWIPRAMQVEFNPTQVWQKQQAVEMANYFMDIQQELLFPKQGSFENVTDRVIKGFQHFYHGRWGDIRNSDTKVIRQRPSWKRIIRPAMMFMLLLGGTAFVMISTLPGKVFPATTVEGMRVGACIVSFVYVMYLLDSTFLSKAGEILKNATERARP